MLARFGETWKHTDNVGDAAMKREESASQHASPPLRWVLLSSLIPVAVAIVLYRNLAGPGLFGSDLPGHAAKVASLLQWPGDWSPMWYGGYHALGLYPPLSYLLPWLLAHVAPVIPAMKAAIGASFIVAAVGATLLCAEWSGSIVGGIIGGTVFAASPLVHGFVYFTGEFADFSAICWAPLACWMTDPHPAPK